MKQHTREAFKEACMSLRGAERGLKEKYGIEGVADHVANAIYHALRGWLSAHNIIRRRRRHLKQRRWDAFREHATFVGSDTFDDIRIKTIRLNFWLVEDPDIYICGLNYWPYDSPDIEERQSFSMEEWKSAAYALIEEARTAIDRAEADCR